MLEHKSAPAIERAAMHSPGIRLAVLLPCLNEAATIGEVVAGFRSSLPEAEIYVIDNGSTDRTAEVARAAGAKVITEPRRGKGNAICRAFTTVESDIYVMADGDGTYDSREAPALIELLVRDRLDMVVAARRKTTDQAYRARHETGNLLFNRGLALLFNSQFKDVFSGYRVLSRRYVKSFPALSDGFEIETEMTVHAILLRMPVEEVYCDYGARPSGSASKLNTWRDGARILRAILRLMRQHRPLVFFSVWSGLVLGASAASFYPVLREYLATGLVPRFPTLMVSIGLAVVGVLLMVCGLILDTTTRTQLEIRRLIYLNAGQGRG